MKHLGQWLAVALILAVWAPAARSLPPQQGAGGEIPLHITSNRLDADQKEGLITFTGTVKAVRGDATLYCDILKVYYTPKEEAKPGAAPAAPAGEAKTAEPAKTAPNPKAEKSKAETANPKAASPKSAKKGEAAGKAKAGQAQAAAAPGAKEADPAKKKGDDKGGMGDLEGSKITKIVATGHVRLVQEDRLATGQEATYYKDKDEVVLIGNPELWRGENNLKGERITYNLSTDKVLVESSPVKRVEAHLYSSNQGTTGAKAATGSTGAKPAPAKGKPGAKAKPAAK